MRQSTKESKINPEMLGARKSKNNSLGRSKVKTKALPWGKARIVGAYGVGIKKKVCIWGRQLKGVGGGER